MRFFWWFLIVLLKVVAGSFDFDAESNRINGENGWYVPQTDGSFAWVDKAEYEQSQTEEDNELDLPMGRLSLNNVEYYLYTRKNPDEPIEITDTYKSISQSTFNASNPTKLVIHGWLRSLGSYLNTEIKEAWLKKQDCNVIKVVWTRSHGEYIQAKNVVPKVGKKIAKLIDYLVEKFNLSLDDVEIIGHSLGAHVAGFTAKNLRSGQVYKIVGLDPAMPLWSYKDTNKRLSSDDARYVETIQTNGGKLGFLKPIGKASFYPNGGKSQPGCILDVTGVCSHCRSVHYYAESIEKDNFPAVTCSEYKDAVAKTCGSTYSSVRMNAPSNVISASGIFYVPVHSDSPYGYGAN